MHRNKQATIQEYFCGRMNVHNEQAAPMFGERLLLIDRPASCDNKIRLFHKQCEQMARSFFNIWPLKQCKFAQQHKQFAKIDSKFCQKVNKAFKNCPNAFKISPNLVTLFTKYKFQTEQLVKFNVSRYNYPKKRAHQLNFRLSKTFIYSKSRTDEILKGRNPVVCGGGGGGHPACLILRRSKLESHCSLQFFYKICS